MTKYDNKIFLMVNTRKLTHLKVSQNGGGLKAREEKEHRGL